MTWHARSQQDGKPLEGEGNRRVRLARSHDDGSSFEAEIPISPGELGACGCCGMGAIADAEGNLYLLYRTAREITHRDMFLLISRDQGQTFQAVDLHPWEIAACPMSTVSLAIANGRVLLSWETQGQIYFTEINRHTMTVGSRVQVPGEGGHRKHPSITANATGQMLVAWAEGTGWKRGGSFAWQIFDERGKVLEPQGRSEGLPAWDFATAIPNKNGFLIIS